MFIFLIALIFPVFVNMGYWSILDLTLKLNLLFIKNIDSLSWNEEDLIYNIVRSFRGMGTICQDVFWEAIDCLIMHKT